MKPLREPIVTLPKVVATCPECGRDDIYVAIDGPRRVVVTHWTKRPGKDGGGVYFGNGAVCPASGQEV